MKLEKYSDVKVRVSRREREIESEQQLRSPHFPVSQGLGVGFSSNRYRRSWLQYRCIITRLMYQHIEAVQIRAVHIRADRSSMFAGTLCVQCEVTLFSMLLMLEDDEPQ